MEKRNSGIYTITSPSGNCYVGSAFDFAKRWRSHLCHLRKGTHHSAALQAAWTKYGEVGMTFAKVVSCDKQSLIMYEQAVIDAFQPKYNMKQVAGNAAGWKHSAETKAKFHLRKKATPNGAAISAANIGRKMPRESVERSANARRGVVSSIETRNKIIAARKLQVMPPMSAETKAKIGAANSGRVASPEARAKNSASKIGIKQSAETIAKRVASRAGYKHSLETIEKMRAAKRRV